MGAKTHWQDLLHEYGTFIVTNEPILITLLTVFHILFAGICSMSPNLGWLDVFLIIILGL